MTDRYVMHYEGKATRDLLMLLSGKLKWLMLLVVLNLLIPEFITALKDVSVTIPQAVKRGSNALLICNYDMENDTLYSVKWYKGRREFYRYTPKENPAMKIFSVASGITVERNLSNQSQVVLSAVALNVSGKFTCEISVEAPSFTTAMVSGEMEVVELPEEQAVVTGIQPRYRIGDLVDGNCSIKYSKPAANLTWTINGIVVPPHHIKTYQIEKYEERNLESVVSAINFMVTTHHFIKGQMKLKCTARIYNIYTEEIENIIEEDRPRIMASGRSYDMNAYPYDQHYSGDGFGDQNESYLTYYSAADVSSSAAPGLRLMYIKWTNWLRQFYLPLVTSLISLPSSTLSPKPLTLLTTRCKLPKVLSPLTLLLSWSKMAAMMSFLPLQMSNMQDESATATTTTKTTLIKLLSLTEKLFMHLVLVAMTATIMYLQKTAGLTLTFIDASKSIKRYAKHCNRRILLRYFKRGTESRPEIFGCGNAVMENCERLNRVSSDGSVETDSGYNDYGRNEERIGNDDSIADDQEYGVINTNQLITEFITNKIVIHFAKGSWIALEGFNIHLMIRYQKRLSRKQQKESFNLQKQQQLMFSQVKQSIVSNLPEKQKILYQLNSRSSQKRATTITKTTTPKADDYLPYTELFNDFFSSHQQYPLLLLPPQYVVKCPCNCQNINNDKPNEKLVHSISSSTSDSENCNKAILQFHLQQSFCQMRRFSMFFLLMTNEKLNIASVVDTAVADVRSIHSTPLVFHSLHQMLNERNIAA